MGCKELTRAELDAILMEMDGANSAEKMDILERWRPRQDRVAPRQVSFSEVGAVPEFDSTKENLVSTIEWSQIHSKRGVELHNGLGYPGAKQPFCLTDDDCTQYDPKFKCRRMSFGIRVLE